MQTFSLKKTGIIFALIIVLMISLELISGIISERSRYRSDARYNISQSWTGSQKVIGPILVVPYTETITTTSWDKKLKQETIHSKQVQRRAFFMPNELSISGDAATELRARGMYSVPVYSSKMRFSGHFSNRKIQAKLKENINLISYGQPWLAVIINDIRGIPSRPELTWNQDQISFVSGSHIGGAAQGMHAELPALDNNPDIDYSFAFDFTLRGMENLDFTPLGMNTSVKLESDWPHPSFSGRYLPEQRQVTPSGFTASWRVSSFSSDIEQQLQACNHNKCKPLMDNTFGVRLIQPIDIYQQSERSIKYGVLFIILTFVAIIIFEICKKLQIHPIQYLLVGLALAIFYLLLISLSEHIPFHWAYAIATAACSGLLSFYLGSVLHSLKQGLILGVLIASLYGILFVILRAENFALLMGCLLLFLVLASLMIITRRIDWYALNPKIEPTNTGDIPTTTQRP